MIRDRAPSSCRTEQLYFLKLYIQLPLSESIADSEKLGRLKCFTGVLQFTTGMNEKHWAASCILHTSISWQKQNKTKNKIYIYGMLNPQVENRTTGEKNKQIQVSKKHSKSRPPSLCSPCLSHPVDQHCQRTLKRPRVF